MGAKAKMRIARNKKNRNSKTFGKALDAELREVLSGQRQRDAAKLFSINTQKASAKIPRRRRVRLMYEAKAEEKRQLKLKHKLKTSVDKDLVEKIKVGLKKGSIESTQQEVAVVDYGLVKEKIPVTGESRELHDPWADEVVQPPNEWCPAPDTRSKKPRSRKRKIGVAVKVCHPGGSYNPSASDHKEGLQNLIAAELSRKVKSKTRISELLDDHESRMKDPQDLPEAEESEDEEDVEQGDESTAKPTTKKQSKLTRAERNRKARALKAEAEIEQRRKEKSFKHELNCIGEIAKAVKKEERNRKEAKKKLKAMIVEKVSNQEPVTKINGKPQERLPPIEVVLPSMLSDNMRRMRPHGGAVFDRFESMQSRNLLETGNLMKRRHKKRGRKKVIEQGKPFIEKVLRNTPKGTKSSKRIKTF